MNRVWEWMLGIGFCGILSLFPLLVNAQGSSSTESPVPALQAEERLSPAALPSCISCHPRETARWQETVHGRWRLSFPERVKEALEIRRREAPELLESPHQKMTCEDCHGAGFSHRQDPRSRKDLRTFAEDDPRPPQEPNRICMNCHRGQDRMDWEAQLRFPTINEVCYRCHPEKQGPFLYEHFPVAENCDLCHRPHRSPYRGLLRIRLPFLCLDCHTDLPPDHQALDPRSRYLWNQGCLNCHPRIHGSTHPGGSFFQR